MSKHQLAAASFPRNGCARRRAKNPSNAHHRVGSTRTSVLSSQHTLESSDVQNSMLWAPHSAAPENCISSAMLGAPAPQCLPSRLMQLANAVRHRASPALIAQDRSAVRYRRSESERMKPARTQVLTPLHSLHFPRTTLTALKTDASAHVLRRENRGSNLKKGTYELQTLASADFDTCNHDFLS